MDSKLDVEAVEEEYKELIELAEGDRDEALTKSSPAAPVKLGKGCSGILLQVFVDIEGDVEEKS